MDFYRELLERQLDSQQKRVLLRPIKDSVSWRHLPKTLIPQRRMAGKVLFVSLIWRRIGYVLSMATADFLTLVGNPALGQEARASLEEHLCRGLPWKPLALPIEETETTVRALMPNRRELDTAAFMGEIGVKLVRVQAYYKDDSPANSRCLNLLQEQGFTPFNGGPPLIPTRITITL